MRTTKVLTTLSAATISGLLAIGEVASAPRIEQPQPADGPTASRFIVVLRTSDLDKAGTDSDIDFGLTWTTPDGDKRGDFVVLPDAPGNNHEKGKVDVHMFKMSHSVPIRNISGAQVVNEMSGDKPGWHIHSLAVMAVDSNEQVWLISDGSINKWLERKSPSLCALAAPMLRTPRDLGTRVGVRDLSNLAVWQDLSDSSRRDVTRAIAEREFSSPARSRDTAREPD